MTSWRHIFLYAKADICLRRDVIFALKRVKKTRIGNTRKAMVDYILCQGEKLRKSLSGMQEIEDNYLFLLIIEIYYMPVEYR